MFILTRCLFGDSSNTFRGGCEVVARYAVMAGSSMTSQWRCEFVRVAAPWVSGHRMAVIWSVDRSLC